MPDFVHFEPSTGRILQAGHCAATDLAHQTFPGAALMLGHGDPQTDYVDRDLYAVRVRPSLAIPLTATLTVGETLAIALPVDAQVEVDGVIMHLPAGEHVLSAEWPGTYAVVIRAWPYRDHALSVEVGP